MVQRKAATKTKAREKARAAAAARVEREQKIMTYSEEFFAKTLAQENKKQTLREQIQKLEQQLAGLDGVVAEAAGEVQEMKELGLTRREIGELLELAPGEISAYLQQHDPSEEGHSAVD